MMYLAWLKFPSHFTNFLEPWLFIYIYMYLPNFSKIDRMQLKVNFKRSILPSRLGRRIHRLLLCRGIRPSPNKSPDYDTKQSDGEVPVMLGLCRIRNTPSLLSLPGPLWSGVVAPDKGLIYELNRTNGILVLNWIVWLNWIACNRDVFHNKIVLIFKQRAHAKFHCLKLNCF